MGNAVVSCYALFCTSPLCRRGFSKTPKGTVFPALSRVVSSTPCETWCMAKTRPSPGAVKACTVFPSVHTSRVSHTLAMTPPVSVVPLYVVDTTRNMSWAGNVAAVAELISDWGLFAGSK